MKPCWIFSIVVAATLFHATKGQGMEAQLRRIETAITNGFSSFQNTTSQIQLIMGKLSSLENKIDELTRQAQRGHSPSSPMAYGGLNSTNASALFSPLNSNVDTTGRIQKLKLRFKVSGKNLPDKDTGISPFDTSDAYFEWHVSSDGGKTKTKLMKSDTINDSENPDWGNVLEFDFDRSRGQWWQFYVYDHDNLREDDTVGRVWVNVADFVDKGQFLLARMDKQNGYLQIQSMQVQTPPFPNTPLGQLPMPAGTMDTALLRFQVSAYNLPTKDDIGFIQGNSDPYVIIKAIDGISGKERDVGRSATVTRSSNPSWGDVFQFQWDRKKDQRLRFTIYDDDTLKDDKLANAYIEVNDYIAHGQVYTLVLPKKGTLTIRRV